MPSTAFFRRLRRTTFGSERALLLTYERRGHPGVPARPLIPLDFELSSPPTSPATGPRRSRSAISPLRGLRRPEQNPHPSLPSEHSHGPGCAGADSPRWPLLGRKGRSVAFPRTLWRVGRPSRLAGVRLRPETISHTVGIPVCQGVGPKSPFLMPILAFIRGLESSYWRMLSGTTLQSLHNARA
jgi:hypothetical protein